MIKEEVSYDDFARLDIRIGEIIAAERVEGTDKLIKCSVDFGEIGDRTIVSGILKWKKPEELIGKKLPYIINLKPRTLKGIDSQGMLLAMSFNEDGFSLLESENDVPPGTSIV
jgi:methionyl-tRNA synthetase